MKINTFEFKGITIEMDVPISDVPCGSCTDCCSKLTPYLTQEEFMSGQYAYTFMRVDESDEPVITVPKGTHGGCMYYVNNSCTIYDKRPKSCRQFDCRYPETSHPKITNKFSNIKELEILGKNIKLKLHSENELYSDIIRRYNSLDIEDMSTYSTALKPGDTHFDIGSNIGLNAIYAAMLVGPEGKVYAFEPDEKNYKLLLENIELNNISNIVAIKNAILDTNRQENIFNSINNFGDHRVGCPITNELGRDHYLGDVVECVSLDYFAEQIPAEELSKLTLIKIDAQGAEVKIIQGAQNLIKKCKPAIVLEYSPHLLQAHGNSPFELLSFMDIYKYSPYRIDLNKSDLYVGMTIEDIIKLTNTCLVNKSHEDLYLESAVKVNV